MTETLTSPLAADARASERIPVAVLGATGSVGQRFVQLLEAHPWFRLHEVVASERSAGRSYGDAADWIDGARDSGWTVSSTPQPDAIMVLPRNDQGSGALGHVAWVLGVEDDGTTIDVRDMNWTGRYRVSYHQLLADGQAQFLTPPASAENRMTGPR